MDDLKALAPARAAGVRAATAPLVFIGETHTYPEDGWAEAILAAFEGPWVAVVPCVTNANPRYPTSCAGYAFDYGNWGPHRPSGEMRDPLTYNTAYRRDALLALDPALERALDPSEALLWPALHAAGHRAWFERTAELRHLNVVGIRRLFQEKFYVGIALGRIRSARWTLPRRIAYTLAAPAIPFVLLGRLRRPFASSEGARPAAIAACLAVSALAKAAGEALAYAGCRCRSAEARVVAFEVRKVHYASPRGT